MVRSANWLISTWATAVPGTRAQLTLGTVIRARVTVRSVRPPWSGWITVRVTGLPAGPRTRSTTWSTLRPLTSRPPTRTITSPGRSPARWAGEPGMGAMIVGRPLRMPTSAPMPSRRLASDAWKACSSLGDRKRVWPVSPSASSMPSTAP